MYTDNWWQAQEADLQLWIRGSINSLKPLSQAEAGRGEELDIGRGGIVMVGGRTEEKKKKNRIFLTPPEQSWDAPSVACQYASTQIRIWYPNCIAPSSYLAGSLCCRAVCVHAVLMLFYIIKVSSQYVTDTSRILMHINKRLYWHCCRMLTYTSFIHYFSYVSLFYKWVVMA